MMLWSTVGWEELYQTSFVRWIKWSNPLLLVLVGVSEQQASFQVAVLLGKASSLMLLVVAEQADMWDWGKNVFKVWLHAASFIDQRICRQLRCTACLFCIPLLEGVSFNQLASRFLSNFDSLRLRFQNDSQIHCNQSEVGTIFFHCGEGNMIDERLATLQSVQPSPEGLMFTSRSLSLSSWADVFAPALWNIWKKKYKKVSHMK